MGVESTIKHIHDLLENIKTEFAEYLQNKKIDIEDRWDTFCIAPIELSNLMTYTPTGLNVDWLDETCSEMYSDVDLLDIMLKYKSDPECLLETTVKYLDKNYDKVRENMMGLNYKRFTLTP